MAKVKLTRDHINDSAGDSIEVTDERAEYFKRVGLVEPVKVKEEKQEIKTKEEKSTPKYK